MAKVVYTSLKPAKRGKGKAAKKGAASTSVVSKRVTGPDGKRKTMHRVDANSPTFGEDISTVFRLNVRLARQNNKRLVGSADRVPAKN